VVLEGEQWFRAVIKHVRDDRPMDGSLLMFAEVKEDVSGGSFFSGTDVVIDAGGGWTVQPCRVPPPSAATGDSVEVRAVLVERRAAPVPEEYGDDLFEGHYLSICESEGLYVTQISP